MGSQEFHFVIKEWNQLPIDACLKSELPPPLRNTSNLTVTRWLSRMFGTALQKTNRESDSHLCVTLQVNNSNNFEHVRTKNIYRLINIELFEKTIASS